MIVRSSRALPAIILLVLGCGGQDAQVAEPPAVLRDRIPDLLRLFDRGARLEKREPARVDGLATELELELLESLKLEGRDAQSLRDRIVIDGFTRREFDRDQNVYLGAFYTRFLTRAVPDVVFQPTTHHEIELVLGWARRRRIGVASESGNLQFRIDLA